MVEQWALVGVNTSQYLFISLLNGLSSPKATWEGEEARRELETRALLSGPLSLTTRHKAEKEKERAVDRRAGGDIRSVVKL